MERRCSLAFVFVSLMASPGLLAADAQYAEFVRPLLQKFCFECHADRMAKGSLKLDSLNPDFHSGNTAETWGEVSRRLGVHGDDAMPPKGKPQPTADEVKRLQEWIASQQSSLLASDAAEQKREGRAQIRRLNRNEYNNTLRDLLGIDIDLRPLLPEDDSVAGFDNVGTGLQITRIHHERYLEAAETALNAAIVTTSRPKAIQIKNPFGKADYPPRKMLEDGTAVLFTSVLADHRAFRAPVRGQYRIRVHVAPYQNAGRAMVVRVNCGSPVDPDERYLGIPSDTTTTLAFTARMGVGHTIRLAPEGFGQFYVKDFSTYPGPGLAIHSVEVEGPLLETWPPASHQRLLGAVDLKQATLAEAEKVLRDFLPRACRRPVADHKAQKFVDFLKSRAERTSVDDALRQSLVAVLCSPDFLMLHESPGPLDEYSLASRLSYFLWRSMPDETLIDLAKQQKLRSPGELRRQVDRMLLDPRAAALPEHFLGQWLGLRQIDATTPDRMLYPEYDDYLRYSMLQEPTAFFEEMLRKDLPLSTIIDSEFAMLNDRLAAHYGIADVVGPEFRRVKLPAGSHRGGVMTMAAILKVTANGTVTSPVLRGAWLLDKIMGQPLKLPSGLSVPAVEPDIRGAHDIRDQLAKHRTVAQCASCHQKIDPFGFALENFDPIGGYRTHYRALGKYPKASVKVHQKSVDYSVGLAVQAGDVMPDGKPFKDSDEFKQLLSENPAPVIRTVAEKLIIYATSSPIRPADAPAIEAIVQRTREKNNGLRSLVHEIVQSDLFLQK